MRGRSGLVLTIFGMLLFALCKAGLVDYNAAVVASASVVSFSFGVACVIVAIVIRIWQSV